jgi:hypothetical protein
MKLRYVSVCMLAMTTWMHTSIAAPAIMERSRTSNSTNPNRFGLPSPLPRADQDAEKSIIHLNGPLPKNVKTKYSMALNATAGPPVSHKPLMLASGSPSTVLVDDLKFYTSLAAATYCGDVQKSSWTCKQCGVVPDGKLVVTFATPKYDTVGYILQSDAKKSIYIVFRGTVS